MKKIVITKKHIKDFQKAIKAWKDDGTYKKDKEMIACYKEDRADMRKIITLLKKSKFCEAWQAMWDLDTIVREQIPNELYNLVVAASDSIQVQEDPLSDELKRQLFLS